MWGRKGKEMRRGSIKETRKRKNKNNEYKTEKEKNC